MNYRLFAYLGGSRFILSISPERGSKNYVRAKLANEEIRATILRNMPIVIARVRGLFIFSEIKKSQPRKKPRIMNAV